MMAPRSSPPSGGGAGRSAHAHAHANAHANANATTPSSGHRGSSPATKISRKNSPPRAQPPHTPDELHFAKRTLQKLVQDSHFFPVHDKNNRVQTIRESELEFGNVIGKGGFCEVRCANLKYSSSWGGGGGGQGNHHHQNHHHHNVNAAIDDGHYNPRSGQRGSITAPKYAMKYLSPSKTTSSRVFQRGIADLAMEACFLSLLRHDNIIGLHYVSEGSLEENYNCAAGQQQQGGGGGGGNANATDGSTSRAGGSTRASSRAQIPDEVVMDAYGNLQLRRQLPQQPPIPPPSDHHLFGYFLLLDPLHESLTDRIEKTYVPQIIPPSNAANNNNSSLLPVPKVWDRIRHKNNGNREQQHDPTDSKDQLIRRLGILKAVASALRYLHDECHIIFRDIKPDNIGFYRRYHPQCQCGYHQHPHQQQHHRHNTSNIPAECTCYDEITKLFDFGLAKELKPQYLCCTHSLGRKKTNPAGDPSGYDTYKLTARSGSRRYMAPEVALSSPYNDRADVYSLGVVLYQVASLVTPFEGYSMYRHEEEVLALGDRPNAKIPRKKRSLKKVKKSVGVSYADWLAGHKRNGGRPEKRNDHLALRTKCVWTEGLKDLIEECWHSNLFLRPSMKDVVERLEGCIQELTTTMPGGKSSKSRGSHLTISQETERISSISHAGDSSNWAVEGIHSNDSQ